MKILSYLVIGYIIIALPARAAAMETVAADVVVIVDTSQSMKKAGMDPERTSLLVTKLFADIVPGDLAVIRLLDLAGDKNVFSFKTTGEMIPCQEDASKMCPSVGVIGAEEWESISKKVQENKFGALIRPERADKHYKQQLERHLQQRIGNSFFDLAFRSAQGIFDEHREKNGASPVHQTIIWLSDGRASESFKPDIINIISKLQKTGVAIEAIIFGKGDPSLAREAGLKVRKASGPAQLMKAFAGIFRHIVKAPYEIDKLVSVTPAFEIKPNVEEAWVVVYGDKTLGDVELKSPDITFSADYAADIWPSAGAYKVAYLHRPKAGQWEVRAVGGGTDAAYAVIQRSSLAPVLLAPETAFSGIAVPLVAGIRAGSDGELMDKLEFLQDVELKAEFQGKTVILSDNGTQGDAVPDDGRYTALVKFQGNDEQAPVQLHLKSRFVEHTTEALVKLTGRFEYTGEMLTVDLGVLHAGQKICHALIFPAEHQGGIPFELQQLIKPLPKGHGLEVRLSTGKALIPDGDPIRVTPDTKFEVCLKTTRKAASSIKEGREPGLMLRVAGSENVEHRIPVSLRWTVEALSFWALWGWLILSILFALLVIFIATGFILPHRFQATLALVFVPDREDLDEHTAQPVKQWKGVGIGFYRNARAFLHADFRLSGKARGALACLQAERGGARAMPEKSALFKETLDGDWEAVAASGQKARPGDIYKIGDKGPYFRITVSR
ncbi:MAG: hypothetical protein GY862_39390 [Gammaproteobacteria bacterium]|nr:hypothetical protein [Gammaproteobacteria bacterium]